MFWHIAVLGSFKQTLCITSPRVLANGGQWVRGHIRKIMWPFISVIGSFSVPVRDKQTLKFAPDIYRVVAEVGNNTSHHGGMTGPAGDILNWKLENYSNTIPHFLVIKPESWKPGSIPDCLWSKVTLLWSEGGAGACCQSQGLGCAVPKISLVSALLILFSVCLSWTPELMTLKSRVKMRGSKFKIIFSFSVDADAEGKILFFVFVWLRIQDIIKIPGQDWAFIAWIIYCHQ